ncbi:ATP-binding protein [Meiothermus sp.]|uniref:sensor histidine kinase n=1 Tax=Meiothermus sp. TaxID=1955249 RepID=UPI00307E28DB
MTVPAPRSRQPAHQLMLVGLALLLVLGALNHTLALVLGWGGDNLQLLLGNTLNLIPDFLGALLVWLVARQHQGEARRAWSLIALALTFNFVGDLTWAYIELVLQDDPFPSIADVFYLAFPLCLLIGLLWLPKTPLSRLESLKLGLDVAVIVSAASVFAWQAFLAKTIADYGNDYLSLGISLAYPVADLALLALLLLMALRQTSGGGYPLLLGLALALMIFADTIYNVQNATESYVTGTLLDSAWSWAIVLFGLAAFSTLYQKTDGWSQGTRRLLAHLGGLGIFAPYAAILLTFYLAVSQSGAEELVETGTLIGAGVVTMLVVIRQVVAFAENRHLTAQLQRFNDELEQRVEERTRELDESRQRLMASEKLAALGKLTAGIAHEINTPLAASLNHLMQARKLAEEYRDSIGVAEVSEADHREIAAELNQALAEANASLERMGEFIRKMRSQARNPEGAVSSFDPVKIARETLALLETEARRAGVQLVLEAPAQSLVLHGEAGRFSQILNNLLQNAIHACEERRDQAGSWVRVEFTQEARQLLMKVEDNGSGIRLEVLPKIFEPLFTTKPIGKGTGLGLPIIQDIVRGHFAGQIDLETTAGKGTTFTLRFPLGPKPPQHPTFA